MKKIVFGVLVLSFVLILGSCGANPKGMAKETYDLSIQAMGALFDAGKASELEKKLANIEAKVEKLSESDKAIYAEELARLFGQGLGGLFGAGLDAASSLSVDKVKEMQRALDTANQQTTDLLNSFEF